MKVLVGLSGGVDSSVAALMLKEQGHEVIGATMSIWGKDGVYKKIAEKINTPSPRERGGERVVPVTSHSACLGPSEKEDIETAREVANFLGIDFYVFDCAQQYEEIVLKNFKEEYLSGRTPNPCVWCNALIKFDLLPNLAKANGIEFDKFATGHYARIEKDSDGQYLLKTAKDTKKDQSYFLYRLKNEQLKNILLPLGDYTKEEIRKYALQKGLKVADKPDSQDFYEGDYNELLEIEKKEGNIVDKNGKILGKHKGFWNFTTGQRKGLKISSTEPLYVLELRKDTNEVVVGKKSSNMKSGLIANKLNHLSVPRMPFECQAKIRSSQIPQKVMVSYCSFDNIKVDFENMQSAVSLGQSVVLYDNDIVLGGGIIDEVF